MSKQTLSLKKQEQIEQVEAQEKDEPTQEQIDRVNQAMEERNNERLARLNQIADQNDEQEPEQVEFKDDIAEAHERETEEAETEARDLQEEGVEKTFKLKVNGKEVEVSEAELIARAQKVSSADEYLQIASEAARNASRQGSSHQDAPVRLGKDELRQTLSAAVMGDEDAIERLASAIAEPSVTPDVLQQIDQRFALRTELASAEAEQGDILNDPYMGRLFRVRLAEMQNQAPDTKITDAYRSIGNELRSAFPEKFKKSPLQAKVERKKTFVNPPTLAGKQQVEANVEESDDPVSIIEQIAKARNQSGAVKHLRY